MGGETVNFLLCQPLPQEFHQFPLLHFSTGKCNAAAQVAGGADKVVVPAVLYDDRRFVWRFIACDDETGAYGRNRPKTVAPLCTHDQEAFHSR